MVVILANSIKQSVLRKDFFSTPVLGPPLKLFTNDFFLFHLHFNCVTLYDGVNKSDRERPRLNLAIARMTAKIAYWILHFSK